MGKGTIPPQAIHPKLGNQESNENERGGAASKEFRPGDNDDDDCCSRMNVDEAGRETG